VGPAGHLLVYESRPLVRRILEQNLGANRVGDVTVMRGRLGPPPAAGAVVEAAATAAGGERGNGTETVDELQLERLDWLKIDAADAAPAVLAGAAQTLWRLRPWLFVAADEATLARLADRAREFGYRCWRQETPLFDPGNFNRRADDRFGGRTALALLAIPEEITVDVALEACIELP
jgi:hypothetical protein